MTQGKKFKAAAAKVDTSRLYDVPEAVGLVKSAAFAKFNETVEVSLRLGVDPKLIGFVGFDDTRGTRAWREEYVRLLQLAS